MNNPNMQQQNGMPNRATAGLHHFVSHYRTQQQHNKVPQGWQQSTSPEERGQLALQFFTQYRLLKPDLSELETMRVSLQFETHNFMTAPSKEQYHHQIRQKLLMMTSARQQQLQRVAGGMAGMNGQINGMNPAQMNMMGQMGQQAPRQGTPQQFNPAFPNAHLQRPMQVSPVPPAQGQPTMGANGANPPNMNQAQNNQQPNLQPNQSQTNPQQHQLINQWAKKLMETCNDEVRLKFEADVQAWPAERKQHLLSQRIDPLFVRFRQHAEMMFRSGRLNQQGLNPNAAAAMQQGAGQQNRMPNQQMNMNQRQPNQEFDFTEITNRQIEAMRSQDQGTTVVPASNNANGGQNAGLQGQNQQSGQPQNTMQQRQAAEAFHRQAQSAQAQAQAQARQSQLEQQRQQQARQQNTMLQGQAGGLNLPQGSQVQSPAMPMLTRQMAPPGQSGPPGTPQPPRPPQAHVPIMTPQSTQADPNLTDLMRQAQQRAAAVSQANQPLTDQVRLNMMPGDLDPSIKQQLLKVPENQFRHILQTYMINYRRNNPMQNVNFPPGQPNPGQPNMAFNQQQQLQPGGIAGQMLGPNMQNMNRPGANFAQQPPGAGQQPLAGQQRGPMPNNQQRLAAAQSLLQQNPGIIHATDAKPFPPQLLNAQVRQSLPPDVKTWNQLKLWVAQNPALVPGTDNQKLIMLQVMHFQDMVKQFGGIPGNLNFAQQPTGPGMAQPGQLTPNQGPPRLPQQQLNMQNMPGLQVTPQDMQMFRQKLTGPQANISDEQLRGYIMAQKMKNLQARQQEHRQRQQQQQLQQQQLLNQQQAQRAQGQQPPPQAGQQQPPARPSTAQSQNTQVTPQPKPAARPQQPPQPAQPQLTNNAGNKGVKRPNEDAMESNADAPQAPAMAPSRSQPGLNLTQEQMSKLTPQQQAQYKAQLLRAQDASNNKMQQQRGSMLNPDELRVRMNDPVRTRQFKQMVDEVEKSIPPRQPVQLPPQVRAGVQKTLREQFARLKQVEHALRIFHASYDTSEPEPVIRQIIRSRALLFQQMNETDGSLHPQVTLTVDEFKNHMNTTLRFVGKITEKMKQQGQSSAAQQPQPPQGSTVPPAQLNAANLKIVEQQQRNSKAPSAPTTDRPPFPIGADSGHGAAHYFEGARPVTNLVLPDKKRPKLGPGSQTSTPGAKASPQIGSGAGNSPELRRQPPPEKQIPQRPTFRCNEGGCEYSVRGFDTQAELEAHSQIHAKIDNPIQFAVESMADYLDVDPKTGEAKNERNTAKPAPKPASTAPRAPAQGVKTEHTPGVPQNAATPVGQQASATAMARVPTQTGIKDSPSSNLLKTPQMVTKAATPGSGARGKATPASVTKPAPKDAVVPDPVKEEEQPMLPMSILDCSYEDTFAALDANGPFTVLDLKDEDQAWALRSRPTSPSTTPESSAKDTPSTRQSDISENDNLMINIDLKDADMPDAWMYGDGYHLPMEMQLSDDLANLGVMLPPMDSEDMMLFPDYGTGGMMDLDMLEKTMDSMGGTLDAAMLGA